MRQASPIVLQKLLPLARNRALRRGVLAAVLPFVGVVAAFGIAPNTITEKIELTRVIEEVTLAQAPAAPVAEETYWREERI